MTCLLARAACALKYSRQPVAVRPLLRAFLGDPISAPADVLNMLNVRVVRDGGGPPPVAHGDVEGVEGVRLESRSHVT
jgi:hypothetical protein